MLLLENDGDRPMGDERLIEFSDNVIVFGADLSLNRPGFCRIQLSKEADKYKINSVNVISIDNKSKAKNASKVRGEKLNDIAEGFSDFISDYIGTPTQLFFVRETSVNNMYTGGRTSGRARSGISEVVGVMDYTLWKKADSEWNELYPTTIKKLITGSGKAEKETVTEYVKEYLGDIEFHNDDESDAAAVALAWLISNGCIDHKIKEKEE